MVKGKRGPILVSQKEQELRALAKQMRSEFDLHAKHAAAAKVLMALEIYSQQAVFAVNAAANGDDALTGAAMALHSAVRAIQDRMAEIALLELDGWSPYGPGYPAETPDPATLVGAIEDFLAAGGDFSEK